MGESKPRGNGGEDGWRFNHLTVDCQDPIPIAMLSRGLKRGKYKGIIHDGITRPEYQIPISLP